MDAEKILEYGDRCINANYIHVEHDGDYAIQRDGNTLYLLFQWTHGGADWENNFDFPAKPYKDMGTKWYCHRGFLRVWKCIKPYISDAVMDDSVEKVIVVGYSHGAAIATLAHEYVWFNRPDIRENLEGYGFGCPKCYWGCKINKSIKERWANFHPIRNENDIVTHVPPSLLGFVHVNEVIHVHGGYEHVFDASTKKGAFINFLLKICGVGAHYWDRYARGIELLTQQND